MVLKGNWITQTYTGTMAPGASSRLTFPGAVTAFAAFAANLAINSPFQAFGVDGTFTLGPGGTISPVTQSVTVQAGNDFLIVIPARSFRQIRRGAFVFEGTIGGIALKPHLTPTRGNECAFRIEGAGASGLPRVNPVNVWLAIGNNGGSASVRADFDR